MKKPLFILAITIFACSNIFAQTWTPQTSGTTEDLTSVHFTSDLSGWAAGFSGTILHTTDGGLTWNAQTSGTSNYLKDIFFASPTHGWAVGRFGTIVATTDGGTTWTAQSSGISSANLQAVEFSSTTNGWVISDAGDILHTSDGGLTWTPQVSTVSLPLYGLSVISANELVICGALGIILNSYDGGANWNAITTSGTSSTLMDLDFASTTSGWAVGDQMQMIYSIDMGQSWSFSAPSNLAVTSVDFAMVDVGLVGMANGDIYETTGGGNWFLHTSGTTAGIYGIYYSTSGVAWAVGDMGTIITLNNTAGTTELVKNESFEMYPNPTNESFSINANEAISSYSIYTIDGQLIESSAFSAEKINVSSFVNGCYFVEVNFENGSKAIETFYKN